MKNFIQFICNCFYLFFLLSFLGCSGCGSSGYGNSNNDIYISDEITDNDVLDGRGGYDDENSDRSDIGDIRLTGRIETCNNCMGYGSVQDGLYGQPQICKFCWVSTNMRVQQGWTGFDGRFGQVDAVFNTLPADYFDGMDRNADNNGGRTSADQIEAEITRHEQNIAQLEHQLEYIEGSVNRSYLEQQLIEERYEVKRLKNMLNK